MNHLQIELDYLRERNTVLIGRIEEYMDSIHKWVDYANHLEEELARANHPAYKKRNA